MAWYDNIYVWTGFAVLTASAFIGLAYMLSKMFDLPMLEAWVKIELNELAAGMIIAVFCIALVATADGAARFLSGSDAANIVDSARSDFLMGKLYADGQTIYLKLVSAYFELAKVTSYSYSAGLTYGMVSAGYSSSPAAGLSPLQSELGQGIDAVSNFMLLAASQSAFLLFFGNAAVIMLPLGIFLRSFSLTRKLGALVLAAVIATSVIYPASVLLAGEIYGGFRSGLQDTAQKIHVTEAPDPPLVGVVCSDIMKVFVSSPLPLVGGELGWFLSFCLTIGWIPGLQFFCSQGWYVILETVFFTVNSLFPIITYPLVLGMVVAFESSNGWPSALSGYYAPLYNFGMPAVAEYSVLSLVSFLIPVIITVSLLKNLTIMFGGEPQLYGLSKLV